MAEAALSPAPRVLAAPRYYRPSLNRLTRADSPHPLPHPPPPPPPPPPRPCQTITIITAAHRHCHPSQTSHKACLYRPHTDRAEPTHPPPITASAGPPLAQERVYPPPVHTTQPHPTLSVTLYPNTHSHTEEKPWKFGMFGLRTWKKKWP